MSAPGDVILRTGVDNSKVPSGLNQFEAMVDAKLRALQAKMGQLKVPGFGVSGFQSSQLNQMSSQFSRLTSGATTFTNSLNRMSGVLSGGIGIGIAVGGLAALEKGFSRAIEKAKQFQTAQLAIAASIQSSYKVMGGNGQELTGVAGFQAAQVQAKKLNEQIIQRQAKNILTYQEQLGAFQSSVNAGSRKGLSLDQILKVSENIAIAAKTLGLRGEQLANASRLALGGGVNVGRSTIGRSLGISNDDIAKRSGQGLVDFLMTKTKGFSAGQGSFKSSIEGILSTLQARVDVFFAQVGERLFKKIAPSIEKLGSVLESGGAEKFADILVNLFTSVFNAMQMIATSPAIPVIMKFLEFLGSYGDKLLIVGALSKLGGILTGLVGNVRVFTAGLGAMADKALFGAAAIEKEALATAELNEATGGGGTRAAGIGRASRGALAGGVTGIASAVGNTIAARQALYREAVGNVGEFPGLFVGGKTGAFQGRPGSGGATNLPWYAPQYAQAQQEHRKTIGAEMRRIQNEQLSKANRALGDKAFGEFTQNASFVPQVTGAKETEARIAQAEEKARQLQKAEAAERRASFLDKSGLGGGIGGRLSNGALYASLAFMGTELIKTKTDQSANNGVRAFGGALQSGGTVGAGLAGAGLLNTPAGIAATAFAATLGGLKSALDQFDEAVRTSTGALEGFSSAHPQAALIQSLKHRSSQLGRNITSPNDNSAQTNFWAGSLTTTARALGFNYADYTGQAVAPNLLTSRTVEGQKARLSKRILEQQNIGRASFLNDTKQKDIESQIQNITKQLSSEQLGFGNKDVVEDRTLALNKAKIQDAALKGELYVDPLTQKKAQGVFNQAERNRSIFKQIAPNTPMGDEMLKNNSLDQAGQNLKADQLTREAEAKFANERRVAALQQQATVGGLNPDRITGEFSKGIADAEVSIRQRRAEFNMPDKAFEHLVETVKQKFVTDFDMPTKRAEAAIQALNLGGTPQDLAKVVELTIQTTEAKIDKLAKDLHLSASEVGKLKVDAAHKIRAERTLDLLNGGGVGVDEQVARSVRNKRLEFKDLVDQRGFATAERGVTLAQRNLQDVSFANAGERIANQQSRLQEDHPFNQSDARLGLQSATLNARKAQLAPTLDVAAPFSDAASAIRYKIDSERGFDSGKYESAYRESRGIQEQESEMAKESTEIARQRAALNLARTEEDYKVALVDLTSSLEERALEARKTVLSRAQEDSSYAKGQEQNAIKLQEVGGALNRAGFPVSGGIPGVTVPVRGQQGGVTLPAPSSQFGAPGSAAGGSITVNIPITVGDFKDLEAELHKKVPPIIEKWVKNQKRKPH